MLGRAGALFFPIEGLMLGRAGGALVGRMVNLGIDGKFVNGVEAEIKPGRSALFVLDKGIPVTPQLRAGCLRLGAVNSALEFWPASWPPTTASKDQAPARVSGPSSSVARQ